MPDMKKFNKNQGQARKKNNPHARSYSTTATRIKEIFQRLQDDNPYPKTELEYSNPYTLLLAVVLSAQATDNGVNKATKELFRLADTPEKIVALGETKVRNLIKTIGLYRNKAKNLVKLSEQLLLKYNGQVPRDREALQSLPGVGRKTANVVLNVAFGVPTIAVDTHVFRVAKRLGFSRGTSPEEVESDLHRCVPHNYLLNAHSWLILHGRYVCKARTPLCSMCVLTDLCFFTDKKI